MNRFKSSFKPAMSLTVLLLAALAAGCGGSDNGVASTAPGVGAGADGKGQGPAPVIMGTAADYVILAQSAITNVPTSAVTGNVGLSPGTGAGVGLTCVQVTGSIYSVDAAGPLPCRVTDAPRLTTAIADKNIAYTNANARAPDFTELGGGNLGGLNLGPATYKWGTGVLIPTDLTLTGGPNDVWIFQIAQGLSVSSDVKIILVGGALPRNIYWATFAATDFGTHSKFSGTVISQTSITMKTGATINGKLLAGTAVNLDQNTVTP